ncbi:MAG: hypothetical protein ACRDN9_08215 [Streptosporangiaceae bacterium]
MLSADRSRVGFRGIALGASTVYEAVADATCVQGARHRCPSRWCDCGFYCLGSLESAQALACDPQYRGAVVLIVDVLGRYIRYERGLRYSRQRVRVVRVRSCRCGSPAELFADTGHGNVGWHRLEAVCVLCVGRHPVLRFAEFAELAGNGLAVFGAPQARHDLPGRSASPDLAGAEIVPVLSAEVALLQARLDDVQRQLDRLVGGTGRRDAD